MNPLISVIVPVYNVEPYLRKCLDSIVNQTYKNLEIILVDDGSTDNSGIICDEYDEKDKRIKVVHQINQGVSIARNVGLDLCSGDYITFVDSDDWCELDYFEKVIQNINVYKNIDVIITNFIRDYNNRTKLMYMKGDTQILDKFSALKSIVQCKFFGWDVCSTFYKRKCLNGNRFPIDIKFGEDFGFKWNVIRNINSNVLYLPLNGYHYVFRYDSSVNSYTIKEKSISLILQENIMSREIDKKYKILLKKKYLNSAIAYYIEYSFFNISDHVLEKKIKNMIKEISKEKDIGIKLKLKFLLVYFPIPLIKVICILKKLCNL